ncbi:MAG: peptidylprolyl isomerase [Bacteroidota bacterium]|nr:peptidylprolyl isomerase [Bacteroidota bacterium]
MKSPVIKLLAFWALSAGAFAQSTDPVLMTINNKPVLKSEFEYIYNKNNSNNSLDKKTLEEYVDLFINFKLKVEEAKSQGIDTTKSFISELAGYRSQLTKPYLTDSKVDEAMLHEAYDRSKEDIDVSHILIRIPQNASPADTLKAFNQINSIWKRVQKEDFAKVAKEVSQDQSAEQNSGHIGWISAFRTVYPFETMAYNTPVGTISRPVRSAFGYHIIKTHARRNSLGEVLVSHIMIFTTKGDEAQNKKAKATIDSIYQRVLAGDDFGTLAKSHSMDKGSSIKNGELPWFGTGRMVPEFETAAFALKKVGDVSQPIQSAYGWHIIKLMDRKGLAPFEEVKADLERKVKRDERANKGQRAFLAKSRIANNYMENTANIQEFHKLLAKRTLKDSTFIAEAAKLNKPLFNFVGKDYTQADFAKYLKKNNTTEKSIPSEIIDEKLEAFADNELLSYEDSQLENNYPEFRFLMQEYHDGILLFEVSNREVWEKASKDTRGLANYFNTHKSDYTWEKPHFKGHVILCKDKETLAAAKSIVKKSETDSIDKYLRTRLNDSIQYVKVEKGLYVQGENKVVDDQIFKTKEKYVPTKDYPFFFVSGKLLKNKPEDYTDVRGLVTADYQEFLEREWIKALRAKYPVNVDQNVLKTVKKN